jgi:hypothetical protein
LREDVDFHTYQMLEAGVIERRLAIILIGMVRYLRPIRRPNVPS